MRKIGERVRAGSVKGRARVRAGSAVGQKQVRSGVRSGVRAQDGEVIEATKDARTNEKFSRANSHASGG